MIKLRLIITLGVIGALFMTGCMQSPQFGTQIATNTPASPPATAMMTGPEVSTSQPSTGTEGVLSGTTPTGPASQTGATPTPGGAAAPVTVTHDDQGKTITIHNGDSFLLMLGEGFTWDVSISDPGVLSRVVNISVVKGAQGVYQSHKAGSVTLSAIGDPLCRQANPPCAAPSVAFQVTIVVK